MQIVRNILLLWGLLGMTLAAPAQTPGAVPAGDSLQLDIESRMLQYVDDFTQLAIVNDMQMRFSDGIPLSMSYVQVLNDKIKRLNDSFKPMDVRWTTFVQAMQLEIAEDEELMNLMTRVQQVKQTVADSIAAKQQKCDALTDFAKAEELILGQDTVYAGLYKKAFELSLLQKLTPQLEKVKANEQTLFSQIQEYYGKA